ALVLCAPTSVRADDETDDFAIHPRTPQRSSSTEGQECSASSECADDLLCFDGRCKEAKSRNGMLAVGGVIVAAGGVGWLSLGIPGLIYSHTDSSWIPASATFLTVGIISLLVGGTAA